MGENSPQSFTRKESFILFRALLPEIPIDDSEEKIREIIISLIHSNKQFDMSSFSESDFEFIDVNGKQACVPTCQESQQFNGRAIKQIAGTGAVYVRLVKKIPSRVLYVQDDDFELESSTSKSDHAHTYISGSDSDSSVDLPSFLHQSSSGALSRNTAPILQAIQSGSGASSSSNTAPILQAIQSGSGASSSSNTAPILQAIQSGSGASSSSNTAPILQAIQSGSGASSSRNTAPIRQANQSGSGASSSRNTAPIRQANQSGSGASSSRNTAPILQANQSSSGTISSRISAPVVQSNIPSSSRAVAQFDFSDPPLEQLLSDFESPSRSPALSLESLHREFPSFSMSDITVIYEITNCNYYSTQDFLKNTTLDNLLRLLYSSFMHFSTEESPKITIFQSSSPEELTEVLLGFYKSSRFVKNACVRVAIEGNQVMDSGGVRRQLYDQVFQAIAKGHYCIFEGPLERLRPVVKPCNIVSGLLKNFGKAVAHSLIMDHVGFPYLSPPLFYYLIGQEDVAITMLRESDVSGQAEYVVAKVKINVDTFCTLVIIPVFS